MPGYRQHPQMPSFADCIPPCPRAVPCATARDLARRGCEVVLVMPHGRTVIRHPYRHVLSFHQPVAPSAAAGGSGLPPHPRKDTSPANHTHSVFLIRDSPRGQGQRFWRVNKGRQWYGFTLAVRRRKFSQGRRHPKDRHGHKSSKFGGLGGLRKTGPLDTILNEAYVNFLVNLR